MHVVLLTVTCRSGITGNQHLTGIAGYRLNIFVANSMECDGKVTGWEFYALAAGQIYLGLWNYNPAGHTFTLTGKNLVTVGTSDMVKVRYVGRYQSIALKHVALVAQI